MIADKRLLTLVIGLYISFSCLGQKKKDKILYIYTWGMPTFLSNREDSCRSILLEKYGFQYLRKAGCVVYRNQLRKWKRHNNRVVGKLCKRNGLDWENRFEEEMKICRNM